MGYSYLSLTFYISYFLALKQKSRAEIFSRDKYLPMKFFIINTHYQNEDFFFFFLGVKIFNVSFLKRSLIRNMITTSFQKNLLS